jgi:hypothetical protein
MAPKESKDNLPPKDSWRYMENLVMDTLNRLEEHDKEIFKRLNRIDVRIAKLSVKSGIWGLIGACIPVALGLLIAFLKF